MVYVQMYIRGIYVCLIRGIHVCIIRDIYVLCIHRGIAKEQWRTSVHSAHDAYRLCWSAERNNRISIPIRSLLYGHIEKREAQRPKRVFTHMHCKHMLFFLKIKK